MVRVSCSYCEHEFELEFTGLLGGGRGFSVPSHEPQAVRYHGPAYFVELAGRA